MGCSESKLVEAPAEFEYCCFTFHWNDCIRLVYGGSRTTSLVKKAIDNNWTRGSKDAVWNQGAVDIVLNGRPWADVDSLDVVCYILEYLLADGWCVIVRSDMSRMIDLSSWFLRQYPDRRVKKQPAQVACVAMFGGDQLHIIKANEELIDMVKAAIKKRYPKGSSKETVDGDHYKLKLHDDPWISEGDSGMDARRLFLQMLREFESDGYFYYAACNTIIGRSDALYFVKHPDGSGWQKAADDFCMISLNENDKLRLIDCNQSTIDAVRDCLHKYRGKSGIQHERPHHGTHEFKLLGSPWCAEGHEVVGSRYLVTKLFEVMRTCGWELHSAIDMCRKMNDKAVIIFKSAPPAFVPHFCLSPGETDRIRMIGAPHAVTDKVRELLQRTYPPGIASETLDFYEAHEFKLSGLPFFGRNGTHEIHIRAFFCFLLKELEEQMGYRPMVSCDVSAKHVRTENGPDYVVDVNSWWFAKMPQADIQQEED